MNAGRLDVVLAVDPGTEKCGLAVVSAEGVAAREICPTARLVVRVRALCERLGVGRIVVGDGTNGRKLARAIGDQPDLPATELVDEAYTTLEAKNRYFYDNPPRGFRRLIPGSLLTPREPIDDYVAVILAERAIERRPRGV